MMKFRTLDYSMRLKGLRRYLSCMILSIFIENCTKKILKKIYEVPVIFHNSNCHLHIFIHKMVDDQYFTSGNFSAYIRLIWGTKYSQFSTWLDTWLKMRKQLGILFASIHGLFYMLLWGPKPSTMKIPIVDRVNSTLIGLIKDDDCDGG